VVLGYFEKKQPVCYDSGSVGVFSVFLKYGKVAGSVSVIFSYFSCGLGWCTTISGLLFRDGM
jgi:hypothetical protein